MTKTTGDAKTELLKEARERLALCISASSENRAEAMIDHSFYAGNQWPDNMRQLRQIEQRPALTINKLPAIVHQVVNDQRQNRPSIKVHPVDNGADVEVAQVVQGMIRYIEYNSNADTATDTAVAHATIGGEGYFRLVTDFVSAESFDQELRFARVQNPFSVYLGPHTEPDGSDVPFGFITELLPRPEFKASWPNADANSSSIEVGRGDTVWMTPETVRIAEYYKIKITPATLCRLNTGDDVFKDDLPEPLPEGVVIERERESEKRQVLWYKITGVDILEETEILCKWIPLFPVYGDENVVDGKIKRNGIVRFARDPQQMYNFWMTSATEQVSLIPKAPFIGAVGQFNTSKKQWKDANTRSYPFLEYDPVEVGGNLAPMPTRQHMPDVPTGVLAMAMHASDNIKATTGIFDASIGDEGNETSGRAITARQRQGDKANFHFADNLARTIRHAGRCLVDMIPHYYDTQRVVRILGEDEKMNTAEINTPELDEAGAIKVMLNDLSIGKYDVTIGVGPSYSTKRAEFVDAALALGQSAPQIWGAAGDLIVRGMDWPQADEIADRMKRAIPPEIRGPEEGEEDGPQPLPPEVVQVLTQAQAEIQQLHQALQEAQSGIAAKQIETASRERIAAAADANKIEVASINAASKQDVAELSGLVQLLLQKMQPPPVLAEEVSGDMAKD